MKKPTLKKILIFQEVEKNFCTLGLLLILFAERELFKHKREINFLSLRAVVFAWRGRSKFRLYEQVLAFLLFWLDVKSFQNQRQPFSWKTEIGVLEYQSLYIILTRKMKTKVGTHSCDQFIKNFHTTSKMKQPKVYIVPWYNKESAFRRSWRIEKNKLSRNIICGKGNLFLLNTCVY